MKLSEKRFLSFLNEWLPDIRLLEPALAWSITDDLYRFYTDETPFTEKYSDNVETYTFVCFLFRSLMKYEYESLKASEAQKKRYENAAREQREHEVAADYTEEHIDTEVHSMTPEVTLGTHNTIHDNTIKDNTIKDNTIHDNTIKNNNIKNNNTLTDTHTLSHSSVTNHSEDNLCMSPKKEVSESVKELFEKFWNVYPKKFKRESAFEVFAAIDPSEELVNTMISAVNRQKWNEQWKAENGRYIPLAENWLRDRRWEDEIEPTSGGLIPSTVDYSVLFQ